MADKIRFNTRFDLRGNYELSDSENEYTATEKELLEKVRKRKHQDNESEDEVYAFSESEEDDREADMADSDIEGQEKSDDDLPDPKAWGKQKQLYYSTDYVDQDYGGFGNEEEDALMEEREAKNIHKRLVEQLGEQDFTLDILNAPAKESSKRESSPMGGLKQISKRQKLQILEEKSPDLVGLIDDFKSKLTVAKDDLHPVLELVKDGKFPNCSASKFVKTNYNLILNYCTNISFYLLLKSQQINIKNHPVIQRLNQYRQMLKKMEPIYLEVIKPQIDKILHAVKNNLELQLIMETKEEIQKRKLCKGVVERPPKKLKLFNSLKNEEGDDTGVSDDNDDDMENDEVNVSKKIVKDIEESEESGFSDNNDNENDISKPPASAQEVIPGDIGDKREITYQIAKNKGLTPHRKKDLRNPRVKHKLKYRKAKIRRKGAVRESRTEIKRYAGESTGIKANVKKGIKIK